MLARLGLRAPPPPDLGGLFALYGAWCSRMPFDNVRKMTALRGGDAPRLPGAQADDFFESWLADGAGGTCWSSSNALYALARACGFDVTRVAGSMRDLGDVNHGSVVAAVAGERWLIDSSMLCNEPVPLDRGLYVGTDPVFGVEAEHAGPAGRVVWLDMPPNSAWLPCRLSLSGVEHATYRSRYESSLQRSPFNQRLYARRNRPGEMLVLVGNSRFTKTAKGLACSDLSRADLLQSLREEIGVSGPTLDAWVRSGGIDASFEAPTGSRPPPVTGLPPSRR